MTLPELVDYDLPVEGVFHNCCIVSIRKAYPGHARKVMHAIWGTGLLSLTKMVIVVDEYVDVHDYGEVAWQVGANTDPGTRRRAGARAARPARPRAVAAGAGRQARARRDRAPGPARATRASGPRSRA